MNRRELFGALVGLGTVSTVTAAPTPEDIQAAFAFLARRKHIYNEHGEIVAMDVTAIGDRNRCYLPNRRAR